LADLSRTRRLEDRCGQLQVRGNDFLGRSKLLVHLSMRPENNNKNNHFQDLERDEHCYHHEEPAL
jgi:hypothetical protein